ncbi:uncharacterized protein ankrd24 [Aplochiton taeniatus]
MKSLKAKFKKNEWDSVSLSSRRAGQSADCCCNQYSQSQDWSKSDDRLLQAVEQNDLDKVNTLIVKKGLCPTKLDSDGKSAFHLSASRGHLDCLEVILNHGVDVTCADGTGFNALHLAAKNAQSDCLKRLLQERVPVDSTDSFGRTALHHAVVSGCMYCTETLWDFKANLNAQDGEGVTALMLASQMSRVELCAFLLGRGANANIQDNQGRSALMLACESDSPETVETLLRGGASTQTVDALEHNATHYCVATGNQKVTHLLQPGALAWLRSGPPGPDGNLKLWIQRTAGEHPLAPPPIPGGTTPRKRKAPPPPRSPPQGFPPSPEPPAQSLGPHTPSPPAPSPKTQHHAQASLTEDEEVFEEIRRLRLERGRLLQKIKGLEQQQQSALSALKELSQLREQLEQAEMERDRLHGELEELRGQQAMGTSDSEDMDEMLDFPGAEMLLSKRSRESPCAQEESTSQGEPNSADPSSAPGDLSVVAKLRRQVEELASQNSELVLKVQMLEMFEKDDTDMQSSSPDFVPTAQYDSLRKELEALQERHFQAQTSAESSSMADDDGERLRGLEEQLASSQSEMEELREQVRLGALSVGQAAGADSGSPGGPAGDEGASREAEQLRERVKELEAELAGRPGRGEGRREAGVDGDAVEQLRREVEELRAASKERESGANGVGEGSATVRALRETVGALEAALEKSRASEEGGRETRVQGDGEGDVVRRLQERLGQLEGELRRCVPRTELDEVQVSLGLQCEQLARERAQASTRLNEALLELERLRPPSAGGGGGGGDEEEEEEEEEERSEGSEPSITSEPSPRLANRPVLAAGNNPLEAAECPEELKDAVPLAKHQEALSALSNQLSQTVQELQEERALHSQAQEETTRLQAQLQSVQQDLVPREEHEKVKAELQRALQASESSAAAAQEALSDKEAELRELKSQKAAEQGLISKEDHESQRLSLKAEINTISARFNDLTRKHEKTCTEVFQVQREALFNKSERQVAEAQLGKVQQQLADLQAQSSHIQELHKDIQESKGLVKEKDRKITELSKEVFGLKEALGALTPPMGFTSSSSSSPSHHHGNPGQQVALQNRVSALSQQIQDWERKHRQVITVYRTHLLAAVQGRMDEEVQGLLLQILSMSQKEKGNGHPY